MTDFNTIPNRRKNITSNKWNYFPKDVLPMWVADMDFPSAKPILDAIHKNLEQGVLGYEYPTPKFYEIIAERMQKLYNWNIDPDSIVYTAGVNNGYNIAARALCNDKKGFVIQTPVYNEFHDLEMKAGIPKRIAPLLKLKQGNKLSYEVDYTALKKAVKGAGMFLLCHPHNPIGKIFSKRELKQIAEICIENKVTVISDEIHAELLLGNSKFTPLASLSKEIANHTITLISPSKAYNVAGLSAAFAIIPNETIRKQFLEISNGMSYEVSYLGLTATQVAYSGKCDTWIRGLNRYLTTNRDFLIDYVTKNMPNVRITNPDATYLGWLDFTETGIENPYEFFMGKAKVALSDGKKFGKDSKGHVRINFGTSRAILKEGLDKMSKAMRNV